MILTEIKIKQLNVRISEFEDPIFDKNILPIFTTPLLLKEVDARKQSKYKIETLNLEKKLTFKVISFNEIVKELTLKINQIAIDLEPYYYINPSNYNSLPYKVKEIMNKLKLIEKKKEIEDAELRILCSIIKNKKLILYARNWNKNKKIIKPILNNNKKNKNFLNYRNLNFKFNDIWKFNKKAAAASAVAPAQTNSSKETIINKNLLLFSGWIPVSKGALMLLEDQGWDLNLLSNKNNISQRIKYLRPLNLRKFRRLRRLRRLRLMSINLYLHRSKNIDRILKDQEYQGRNHSMLQVINFYNKELKTTTIKNIQSLTSNINLRINDLRTNYIKNQNYQTFNINTHKAKAASRPNYLFKNFTYQSQKVAHKNLNNNYFIKHSHVGTYNKLNFIINWIGENLNNTGYVEQRLDKKNINDIFLIMQNQPTQIPLIEKIKEIPLINKNKKTLNQISWIKTTRKKKKEKIKANKLIQIKRRQKGLEFLLNFKMSDYSSHSINNNNYNNKNKNKFKASVYYTRKNRFKPHISYATQGKKNNDLYNFSRPAAPVSVITSTKTKPVNIAPAQPLPYATNLISKNNSFKPRKSTFNNFTINRKISTLTSSNFSIWRSIKLPKTLKQTLRSCYCGKRVNLINHNNILLTTWTTPATRSHINQIRTFSNNSVPNNFNSNNNLKFATQKKIQIMWLRYVKLRFLELNRDMNKIKINKQINNKRYAGYVENNKTNIIKINPGNTQFSNSQIYLLKSKIKSYPFLQQKNTKLIIRLNNLESKLNNWKKKKNLLRDLLNKTSLRYVKSQLRLNNNNNFSASAAVNEYFNNKQTKLMKEKLSKILYNNYFNKLKFYTKPKGYKAWKKITTLLKSSSSINYQYQSSGIKSSRAPLFWLIIKLYSSSFYPMLNSLNNKYFSQLAYGNEQVAQARGFLGKSSAQLKLYNKNNVYGSSVRNLNFLKISQVTQVTQAIEAPQLKDITKFTNARVIGRKESAAAALRDQLIKKEAIKTLQPLNSKESFKKFPDYSAKANNKRFLFLYFLLPIFFSITKKNNIGMVQIINQEKQFSSLIKLMLNSGSLTRSHWIQNHRIKLNNNSSNYFSTNFNNELKSNQLTAYGALDKDINNFIKLLYFNTNNVAFQKSKLLTNIKDSSLINNDLSNAYVTKFRNKLLKWSILLIAESLVPLKNKKKEHNYYYLIFIKILKAAGFLSRTRYGYATLDTQASSKGEILKNKNPRINSKLKNITNAKTLNKKNKKEVNKNLSVPLPTILNKKKILQTQAGPAEKNIESREEHLNNNKQTLITYYPGGRYLSDWKRISKIIWQEEYKFNALYRRMKISLNLAKYNTNINFKNIFTIITILTIIKLRKIKAIFTFKLKILFFNNPIKIKQIYFKLKQSGVSSHTQSAQSQQSTQSLQSNSTINNNKQVHIIKLTNSIYQHYLGKAGENNLTILENNFKYPIIKFILKVLNKFSQPSKNFYNGRFSFINNKLLLNKVKINLKSNNKIAPKFKLLNLSNKLITKTINKQSYLFNNLPYATGNARKARAALRLRERQINYLRLRRPGAVAGTNNTKLSLATNPYNLSYNLIYIFKKIYIFNPKFKYIKHICSEPINATVRRSAWPMEKKFKPFIQSYVNKGQSLTNKIILQNTNNFKSSIENNKSFNNLVNAKLIIIGKIRSIKLIELIDKMKEEIIIIEKLAALVRVSDITDLNLINKKKSRHINSNKYLNKKNIFRTNRIKIIQTIKIIKTDFKFEPKLDSNSLSNVPVSLLYYSNLKPIHLIKDQRSNNTSPLSSYSNKDLNTNSIHEIKNITPPVLSAYLRELSIYNRETKGIINYFSKIIGYNFNTNSNKISSTIYELLESSFNAMRCLISKPIFIITPDKITIQLFYFLLIANKKKLKKFKKIKHYNLMRQNYNKKRLKETKNLNLHSLNEVFPDQLKLLCARLNKVFNKPVELNLTRLHYPSEDSNILVNLMGIIINKIRLSKIFSRLFRGSIIKSLTKFKRHKYNDISIIPAFLTGLNIKVAGRILTQRIKPRKTIIFRRRGATAKGKINYLNFARLTNKNKRGSYSITIFAGQNYFK